MTIRLIQLQRGPERRVARVDEPQVRLLDQEVKSVLALVNRSLEGGATMEELVGAAAREAIDYEPIYEGQSEWKILPPIDHPEPARCLISGTGLTHLGSAKNRDAMHEKKSVEEEKNLTDSMKMFRWGVERGKPEAGQIGLAPEWFYKGTGQELRTHNQPLDWPAHAEDGGEEAEIAGIYIIDPQGRPVRIGMAQGNEFSDHKFEKRNYLNLAGSKLRTSSIGPELVIDPDFSNVPGHARINRPNRQTGTEEIVWSKPICTGESEMCHSLANIEHHHFKFAGHRRPGDVHVHFFGACALSFGEGIVLQDGDIMQVQFKGFGRALRNPLRVEKGPQSLVGVKSLS